MTELKISLFATVKKLMNEQCSSMTGNQSLMINDTTKRGNQTLYSLLMKVDNFAEEVLPEQRKNKKIQCEADPAS